MPLMELGKLEQAVGPWLRPSVKSNADEQSKLSNSKRIPALTSAALVSRRAEPKAVIFLQVIKYKRKQVASVYDAAIRCSDGRTLLMVGLPEQHQSAREEFGRRKRRDLMREGM